MTALYAVVFWFSSLIERGQLPGSLVATALLSTLFAAATARALRRPPLQRDVNLMAVATFGLLMATRILAMPNSPVLDQAAYLLAVPGAGAWAVWSRHLAAARPARLAHPGPGPPRIPEHPRDSRPTGQRAKNLASPASGARKGPRTAAPSYEVGKTFERERTPSRARTRRLNGKLR